MKNNVLDKKICIFGTGGFGREVFTIVKEIANLKKLNVEAYSIFMVDDEYYRDEMIMGVKVLPRSYFNVDEYNVVVAVGDPHQRRAIVNSFPAGTTYATLIHPGVVISDWVELGEGCVVTAGCILTCNIKIGKYAHLNLHTTIGHDCVIGDFFTTAPAVNISGKCIIGNNVYIGTNASIKQGISICDNVTIGMGSVVVKDITEPGTYVGIPARKL